MQNYVCCRNDGTAVFVVSAPTAKHARRYLAKNFIDVGMDEDRLTWLRATTSKVIRMPVQSKKTQVRFLFIKGV